MKKLLLFSASVSALMFASCDNKGNSYEFAQILYPGSSVAVIYADQMVDSLKFATTYDWTLTLTADWMHVDESQSAGVVPEGYYDTRLVTLNVDANTTDTLRSAAVYFNADGKSLVASYVQLHYLNIARPERRDYRFLQTDSATQVRDSLVFTVYSGDWSLDFKEGEVPDWLHWDEATGRSGLPGRHYVAYTLDANETGTSRTALMELKSRGVTTEVRVVQNARKSGAASIE